MRKSLAGLSLRDFEYVEAVAELQHFGQAAARCGVSQPALSEQIRKLEGQLGVALFERTKRRVALTTEGTALLRQIERVLAEARHLLAMGGRRDALLDGDLMLGVIETLGPYYLPNCMTVLRAALPDISLHLTESRTATLLERLRHGALDLILIAQEEELAGVTTAPLFFEPFMLAAPLHYPLGDLLHVRLDSLRLQDLLLLEEGHCLRDQALRLCAGAPAAPRHTTGLETLCHMIAAGEGISLLPALTVKARPDIAALMQCRPLAEPGAGRRIALAWRNSDPRESQFRYLTSLLRANAPAGVRAEPAE